MEKGISETQGVMIGVLVTIIMTWATYLHSVYYFLTGALLFTMLISWMSIIVFIIAMMDEEEPKKETNEKGDD